MTWALAVAQVKTNLQAAAAGLTPQIELVRAGEPDALNMDQVAYWPAGWRDSRTGGETLTKKSIERGLQITIFLRASARSGEVDEDLEDRLVEVEVAMIQALMSDRDLGGNAIGLFIDEADYGWAELAGQLARTSTFVAWIDLSETFTTSL